MAARARTGSSTWTVITFGGLLAWIGGVVLVAIRHDDPSDPMPILRAFALGGGAFFAVVFAVAALDARRRHLRLDEDLYATLAGAGTVEGPVGSGRTGRPGGNAGAVSRTSHPDLALPAGTGRRTVWVYLAFGAVTTGLALAAIGLGPDGPYAQLYAAAGAAAVVWAVYGAYAMTRAFAVAGSALAPLGLGVSDIPRWVPRPYGGGVFLTGATTMTGTRHGRRVSITQEPRLAVTAIEGAFGEHTWRDGARMAALTGRPARDWRGVEATATDGGIVVRRTGNGAGRWILHDLLLAERLAAEWSGSA